MFVLVWGMAQMGLAAVLSSADGVQQWLGLAMPVLAKYTPEGPEMPPLRCSTVDSGKLPSLKSW